MEIVQCTQNRFKCRANAVRMHKKGELTALKWLCRSRRRRKKKRRRQNADRDKSHIVRKAIHRCAGIRSDSANAALRLWARLNIDVDSNQIMIDCLSKRLFKRRCTVSIPFRRVCRLNRLGLVFSWRCVNKCDGCQSSGDGFCRFTKWINRVRLFLVSAH